MASIERFYVYTSIEHTDIRDDGYVYVLFHGWRPSMKGVDTKIDW